MEREPDNRLTRLLGRIQEALPSLSGFRTLSLFGSLAEGRADAYSDLDIIVTTDNLLDARTEVLRLLEEVCPVEFCWAMNLRSDEWNPTFVFREESYYHKLDLGLVDASAENRTIPAEQTRLLCDKPVSAARALSKSEAYFPEHGSVGHFLLGQLLGCIRYLKARKRGQSMTCYRFAAASIEWRLAVLYARLIGNPCVQSKLSTVEYTELDRLLTSDHSAVLVADLDFASPPAMDCAIRTAMEAMIEDGRHLASLAGEVLPAAIFERALAFFDEELRHADH